MDMPVATPKGSEIERSATVIIAARPGRMRDSLKLLLRTIPGIKIVGQADDSSSALRMMAEHRPALAVVDTNLPDACTEPGRSDGFLTVLREIKVRKSETRCLVLADTGQKQADAAAAGADAVLRKGFPAEELFAVMERLLSA